MIEHRDLMPGLRQQSGTRQATDTGTDDCNGCAGRGDLNLCHFEPLPGGVRRKPMPANQMSAGMRLAGLFVVQPIVIVVFRAGL